jgi:hypothetical protein
LVFRQLFSTVWKIAEHPVGSRYLQLFVNKSEGVAATAVARPNVNKLKINRGFFMIALIRFEKNLPTLFTGVQLFPDVAIISHKPLRLMFFGSVFD